MNELQRKTGLSKKDIKAFLHQQDVYTKHKPLVHKFRRRNIYFSHIVDDQWQADLIDMREFKSFNADTNYILSVIDIFSKHAWAVPIKKTGEEIVKAFESIFKGRKPERLQTDK